MVFQVSSQNSLKTPRVQTLINSKGDTLIQMNLADAKVVLTTIIEKQYVDSILLVYINRDTINQKTITLQVQKIRLLELKSSNQDQMISNLNKIVSNKDTEIVLLKDTVKQQKKEIRKQKIFKILGFSAAVILPILVIILIK